MKLDFNELLKGVSAEVEKRADLDRTLPGLFNKPPIPAPARNTEELHRVNTLGRLFGGLKDNWSHAGAIGDFESAWRHRSHEMNKYYSNLENQAKSVNDVQALNNIKKERDVASRKNDLDFRQAKEWYANKYEPFVAKQRNLEQAVKFQQEGKQLGADLGRFSDRPAVDLARPIEIPTQVDNPFVSSFMDKMHPVETQETREGIRKGTTNLLSNSPGILTNQPATGEFGGQLSLGTAQQNPTSSPLFTQQPLLSNQPSRQQAGNQPTQTGQGEEASTSWLKSIFSNSTQASNAAQKTSTAPQQAQAKPATSIPYSPIPGAGSSHIQNYNPPKSEKSFTRNLLEDLPGFKALYAADDFTDFLKKLPEHIETGIKNVFGDYGKLALPVGILGFLALTHLFRGQKGGGAQNININLGGSTAPAMFTSSGVRSMSDREVVAMQKEADMVTDALANAVKNRLANKVIDKVIAEPASAEQKEDKQLEIVSKYPEMAALLKDEQNKAYLERLMKENA